MPGQIRAIWAQSLNGALGKDGQLLYRIRDDLKRFKELTHNSVVIMGRKTWNSLPAPLQERYNVVLSRNKDFYVDNDNVEVIHDLQAFMKRHAGKDIWIIGGAEVYKAAMEYVEKIYITWVHRHVFDRQADTWAPVLADKDWKEISKSRLILDHNTGVQYHYSVYKRVRQLHFVKKAP